MELIDQHTKEIMEGCKERARDAGLSFKDETLEYIVTNRDLLELSPKAMIPTLYDYWVHDVEVLKERGRYELYPHNPFETVINTNPAISFYNDNNPDWLNVMIFYHVLAHIDFFQNNMLFKHTWNDDFTGEALSDKRLIAMYRSEKGRWTDYVIEFTRGMDNLVGYFPILSKLNTPDNLNTSNKLDFYFDLFLQTLQEISTHEFLKEIESYNDHLRQFGDHAEAVFFSDVVKRYPEFESLFEKHTKKKILSDRDPIQYIQENSQFLRQEENKWMHSVMQIIRRTSLFFQPQIRTKILNEGWASYWHEKLFLRDERIQGNEVGFARINAKVTALPRVGLNPYALGLRLFTYIEEMADKGKFSYDFQKIAGIQERQEYDRKCGAGRDYLFMIRENFSDFMFINSFIEQEFVDRHQLFVTGKRLNNRKGVWEYYVKSRDSGSYKEMLMNSLYHPPYVTIDESQMKDDELYLNHQFEGKPLVKEFIPNTLLGIEYLWGGPVKLETTELHEDGSASDPSNRPGFYPPFIKEKQTQKKDPVFKRILYTMKKGKLSKRAL